MAQNESNQRVKVPPRDNSVRRHGRDDFYIPGEGVLAPDAPEQKYARCRPATAIEDIRKFRFSRIFANTAVIVPPSPGLLHNLAEAMTAQGAGADSKIPAGFTYLGQFIDHDLTLDKTARALGSQVTLDELLQGRSPALDLDCLYGLGPSKQPQFYSDGARLLTGTTAGSNFPANHQIAAVDLEGFDLPRVGVGSTKQARRQALIPDHRNDENLAVAQVHAAFIRFHNRVVDYWASKSTHAELFETARSEVVKHYQWMVREDYLTRILDPSVHDAVFGIRGGRRFFEAPQSRADVDATNYTPMQYGIEYGSMPIEFSVAAFRMGHSMVREDYSWNAVFQPGGPGPTATLELLFNFSGTSGTLSPAAPPEDVFERLPTNWIAAWPRLFQFEEGAQVNFARRIDTRLVDPLKRLPERSFGGLAGHFPAALQMNLAFRNLERGRMVGLPSGQQLAQLFGFEPLDDKQILEGNGGVVLELSKEEKQELLRRTPLWFYVLREAEFSGHEGLGKVGSLIVAETFHRAMETSSHSIIRDPTWRPTHGREGSFNMVDLLKFAFEDNPRLLDPLGHH